DRPAVDRRGLERQIVEGPPVHCTVNEGVGAVVAVALPPHAGAAGRIWFGLDLSRVELPAHALARIDVVLPGDRARYRQRRHECEISLRALDVDPRLAIARDRLSQLGDAAVYLAEILVALAVRRQSERATGALEQRVGQKGVRLGSKHIADAIL